MQYSVAAMAFANRAEESPSRYNGSPDGGDNKPNVGHSGFAGPLMVIIEYVPYGDLLGYLRKSRGLNDTYYKDPDVKPKTSLTSQQLMRFACQVADGMSFLSSKKVGRKLGAYMA